MEKKKNRSVFVIYEDEKHRAAAVSFCDQLIERFWTRCGFDIAWTSFGELKDPTRLAKAVEKAAEAQMIVFAAQPYGWIPEDVRKWAEGWQTKPGEREGVLIGLGDPSGEGEDFSSTFTWVRGLARRSGFDYLTEAPQEFDAMADSPEAYAERATAVTSVLDEILRYHPLPGRKL